MTRARIPRSYWWILIPSILIGLYPLMYFLIDVEFVLLSSKPDSLLSDLFWRVPFYLHIAFGGIALLTGAFQFLKGYRDQHIKRHQSIGYVYVTSVLIAGLAGFILSFSATGGIISSLGFGTLSVIWLSITIAAVVAATTKRIERHRKLMTYSFAATFAAVSLRIWLPILVPIFASFEPAYQLVSWLCWLPNLIVAYLLNQKSIDIA